LEAQLVHYILVERGGKNNIFLFTTGC